MGSINEKIEVKNLVTQPFKYEKCLPNGSKWSLVVMWQVLGVVTLLALKKCQIVATDVAWAQLCGEYKASCLPAVSTVQHRVSATWKRREMQRWAAKTAFHLRVNRIFEERWRGGQQKLHGYAFGPFIITVIAKSYFDGHCLDLKYCTLQGFIINIFFSFFCYEIYSVMCTQTPF